MKKLEIFLGILKIPADFCAILIAFIIAYKLRLQPDIIPGFNFPFDPNELVSLQEYFKFALKFALALVTVFAFNGMYTLKTNFKLSRELGKTFTLSLAWLTLIIVYFFIVREFPYSRLALAYSWILSVILMWAGKIFLRLIQHYLLKRGFGQIRTLIIGCNSLTKNLIKELEKNLEYKVIGIIDDSCQDKISVPVLGTINELNEIVKHHSIDEIIQTKANISHTVAADILDFCREHHVNYSFVPDLLETQRSNIQISTLNDIPIISLKPTPLDGWGKVAKRIFDIVGAITGIMITSPILIVTALAIKIESKKSTILFKYLDNGEIAKRVGQYGKLFRCYKFRSMKPGTHNMRYSDELADKNLRQGTPLVKIKDDPRVTKIGRIIRKTSIDELPSLFNVLKGEMSLVGPRPHLPEEVAKYQKHHKFVLAIKPGVTGLAQIKGRSDLNFEKEVKLDTYYIEHWSLWLDIKIILKTFLVLARGYRE